MDRNSFRVCDYIRGMRSLSARRAWIEIPALLSNNQNAGVALRKESVDRNQSSVPLDPVDIQSLSARRAWIEITVTRESFSTSSSRSPQGERG